MAMHTATVTVTDRNGRRLRSIDLTAETVLDLNKLVDAEIVVAAKTFEADRYIFVNRHNCDVSYSADQISPITRQPLADVDTFRRARRQVRS